MGFGGRSNGRASPDEEARIWGPGREAALA